MEIHTFLKLGMRDDVTAGTLALWKRRPSQTEPALAAAREKNAVWRWVCQQSVASV